MRRDAHALMKSLQNNMKHFAKGPGSDIEEIWSSGGGGGERERERESGWGEKKERVTNNFNTWKVLFKDWKKGILNRWWNLEGKNCQCVLFPDEFLLRRHSTEMRRSRLVGRQAWSKQVSSSSSVLLLLLLRCVVSESSAYLSRREEFSLHKWWEEENVEIISYWVCLGRHVEYTELIFNRKSNENNTPGWCSWRLLLWEGGRRTNDRPRERRDLDCQRHSRDDEYELWEWGRIEKC